MKNNHWRSFKKGMSWFLTCDFTFNGYKKTEYQNGVKKNGTHVMGWMAGNTLLLYTLVSGIGIKNTELIKGSNREKTYYNVTNGERTANFMIMPRLQISSATNGRMNW